MLGLLNNLTLVMGKEMGEGKKKEKVKVRGRKFKKKKLNEIIHIV